MRLSTPSISTHRLPALPVPWPRANCSSSATTKALGNAPAHVLFDRLAIEPFANTPAHDGKPPRKFADYAPRITFDSEPLDDFVKRGESEDLGNGVTLIRRI